MTKARDLANASTALSAVSATELGYVDGVTSAIQTQIDTKLATATAASTYAPSSTAATLSGTQTLTNKTIDTASNTITGAVTLTGTQTLTNKTLTTPVISSITNTGTLTLPTSTGTVALTSGVINNTLTTTTGDIIYASGANTPARLGIGSSGQVLSVSGGVPAWATAGGGAVVQVKSFSANPATQYTTTTSSSYVDTTQTLSITPTSASNKILVIASFNIYAMGNASIYDTGTATNVVRNSTQLYELGSYFYHGNGTYRTDLGVPGVITYLDSPATTSSVTYKQQVKISMGSPVGSSTFTPITITLMEVTP